MEPKKQEVAFESDECAVRRDVWLVGR